MATEQRKHNVGKQTNIIFLCARDFGIPNEDQITKDTGDVFWLVELSRKPRSVDTTGFP